MMLRGKTSSPSCDHNNVNCLSDTTTFRTGNFLGRDISCSRAAANSAKVFNAGLITVGDPIGDGVTTGALRLLEDLGVDPGAIPSWTPVDDIHVVSPSGHVGTFPLPRGRGAFAVVCRRIDLDVAIVDRAVAAGAELLEGAEVTTA